MSAPIIIEHCPQMCRFRIFHIEFGTRRLMGPRLERDYVADAVECYENHAPGKKQIRFLLKNILLTCISLRIHDLRWVANDRREGIIVHICASHSSNIKAYSKEFLFNNLFDIVLSFKYPKLIYVRSFEMIRSQTCRGPTLCVGWMRGTVVYGNSLSMGNLEVHTALCESEPSY